MLRKYHTKALAWPEKTLSMMQQQMLEDSEARIAQLPSFGLWTGCTDTNVEELWHISYDAQERSGETVLHTVELLRKRVLDLLPEELPEGAVRLSLSPERTLEAMRLLHREMILRQYAPPDGGK